jgi:methylthioribose-1-phosphate isomerase
MEAIRWKESHLELIDQRLLPHQESWVIAKDSASVAKAINKMVVRGAPAIAISAAYGMALAIKSGENRKIASNRLLAARPTAVNLQWALERISKIPDEFVEAEAIKIHQEDLHLNHSIGSHGAPLLEGGVLTICNTGSLATSGHGTALGMIRTAHNQSNNIHVYALETRPYLQGARLTAYECVQERIPCTLITDGMVGALLATGNISSAVAGCDRVANNGDTANKIGTYQLAVLCRAHGIPFYIAMPTTTLDRKCPDGSHIPIEERSADEVRNFHNVPIAPKDVNVWNPAFDVTPAHLITAWITEQGIWNLPFPNEQIS